MIYLAPLQGFTDFVYRNAYAQVFSGIDAFYIPYITTKQLQVLRKYEKEILPGNNVPGRSVPQILVKDEQEILVLCSLLRDFGYNEINLNLGCPYPMVTNRGKGSKLLSEPRELESMLAFFFGNFEMELSIKMRAGFESIADLERIIPVLNRFPLKRVIIHPRIAKQMYKGEILTSAFQYAVDHLRQVPVYNGDVFTLSDFRRHSENFSLVADWMLGRGVLMNAFLPDEILERHFSEEVKRQKLLQFHSLVFEKYLETTDNPGNALNKMQQFWVYFSHHFTGQKKFFKLMKKAKSPEILKSEAGKVITGAELLKTD